MSVPRGIPTVTYLRVNSSPQSGWTDVVSDGPNSVTILETEKALSRHDVAQVLDKTLLDEDVCENTIGTLAGAGLGVALNPISAFVEDAATSVILMIGSKATRKWQFLKRFFLPFLANELFSNHINEKEDQTLGFYEAVVSISAFEVQDEVVTDLLRPSSRGLSVSFSSTDGIAIQGLQKERVSDEMSLRRVIMEACENRAVNTLPLGGSIDTSSAVWEIELRQNEKGTSLQDPLNSFRSRLIVVDIAAVDALLLDTSPSLSSNGPTLHRSVCTFEDVVKKLSLPATSPLAPFRGSKLTHYLSELLGGDAIVVAIGFVAQGEPPATRKTLELITDLSKVTHYPIGGKEITEVLQGLLGKYRSMVLELQHDLFLSNQSNTILKLNFEKHSDNELKEKKERNEMIEKNERSNGIMKSESENNVRNDKKDITAKLRIDEENAERERNDRNDREKEKERYDKEKKEQNEKNEKEKKDIQQVYEKLFIEMDEKIRIEYENKILNNGTEYKNMMDQKDVEMRKIIKEQEQDFREQYQALQDECEMANEDRDKLYKISEMLHSKYNALLTDNAVLARDALNAEEERALSGFETPVHDPSKPFENTLERKGSLLDKEAIKEAMKREIEETMRKERDEKEREKTTRMEREEGDKREEELRERETALNNANNDLEKRLIVANQRIQDLENNNLAEEEKKKNQITESENQLLLAEKRKEENDKEIDLLKIELLEIKSFLDESESSKNMLSSQLIEKNEEIELLKQSVTDNQIVFDKSEEEWKNEEQSMRNNNNEEFLVKDEEIKSLKNLISEAELKTNLLTEQLEESRLLLITERADRIECDRIAVEFLAANNSLRAAQMAQEDDRIEMERKGEELREVERQRHKREKEEIDTAARELSELHSLQLAAKDREIETATAKCANLSADVKAAQTEIERLILLAEENCTSNKNSIEIEKQKIRKLETKNRDLERDLSRLDGDNKNAQNDLAKQNEELKSIRKAYREKLSSLLSVHEEFSPSKLSKNNSDVTEPGTPNTEREDRDVKEKGKDPLSDLLISYNNSEEKMLQALNKSNTQVKLLKENLRALYDRYRACLDSLAEAQEAEADYSPVITEELTLGNDSLALSSSLMVDSEREQREAQDAITQWREGGPLEDQERAALVLSAYKKSLEKSETQLAMSRQEVATLHVQMRTLMEGSRRPSQNPNNMVHRGSEGGSFAGLPGLGGIEGADKRALDKQLKESRSQIQALTEQIEHLTLAKSAPEVDINNLDSVYYRKMASDLEARSALLASRNAALESELKSYQEYMKTTVMQYKRKIQNMKDGSGGSGMVTPTHRGSVAVRGSVPENKYTPLIEINEKDKEKEKETDKEKDREKERDFVLLSYSDNRLNSMSNMSAALEDLKDENSKIGKNESDSGKRIREETKFPQIV